LIIITCGDKEIYNPKNPYLQLINPKLTLEDNAAGSLTFKIYETNLHYESIRKLYPVISVIRNDSTIFKGRVIMDQQDFYKGKSVEVEGKLAFFNDSYMEPFSFSGSPEELFRVLIENHNAQVLPWQRFKMGIITVKDANDYIVRSSEFVLNTWEVLKTKCFQSTLGGHIRIRYEADGDYVDWLADYEKVSSQSIEFAKNMIDLALTVDATETYTAIRPVGADMEGKKVDISSVNEGKNYLINEEKANTYGVIYAPSDASTWEDVTIPANLLKKAKEKLYGTFTTLKETYEIKAVDLNLTDESIEALNIYEYVPVKSNTHGIDEKYILNRAEIHIAEPQNSVYHLGASKRTFEDVSSRSKNDSSVSIPKDISAFNNDKNYVSEDQAKGMLEGYMQAEDVEDIILQRIEELPSGKDGASAYDLAVNSGFAGTEEEWIASLQGKDGKTPTIRIGNVTTGNPGTAAGVTNIGTDTDIILDFIIPQGASGSGSGGVTTLTYEETKNFLDSDSDEDIGSGDNILSYDETLEYLNSENNVDI